MFKLISHPIIERHDIAEMQSNCWLVYLDDLC